jgi:hypothetical protein
MAKSVSFCAVLLTQTEASVRNEIGMVVRSTLWARLAPGSKRSTPTIIRRPQTKMINLPYHQTVAEDPMVDQIFAPLI